MMKKRELLAGLALLPWATPALAQEYPSRPIRLLVGFAAGGSTDVFARAIAPRLQALLGQPVVIENRPGAGGNIATEATARSAPDGYTLLLGTIGPLAINPTLYGNLSFDPLKDLTPVSLVGEVPNVLAVPVDRPFRSVADIIAAAKARPEALNFGSSGIGSAGHLAAEQLNLMAGIRTTHVPYRGGGALLPELIAGRVDYAFTTALNGIPQAEAGKLRILGVPNGKRVPLLPEIPTIAESGLPGFDGVDWAAMMAPPGLPAPILAKLNAAMQSVLREPELVAAMAARRLVLEASTPEALAEFLRQETARWAPVVRASGARPD
ncbi:MAG: tripartite tricarboxylate transporter substrate binding protein [Roseomonas sp.]|nr:tripartite tricarboxylate transporter substrate binding protein [Roseomonas sp.]MCA3426340.1 tripartite tricarboxylate transporter substrate binding protein [Roseomonas sp.]